MTSRVWTAWALITALLAAARALEMSHNAAAVGGRFALGDAAVLFGITAAAAMHAGVLAWLASRARLPDPARRTAIAGIGLGFVVVNNLEAVVFAIAPLRPLLLLAAMGAAVHVLATVVVCRLLPASARDATTPASPFASFTRHRAIIRVAILGVVYTVIYFLAGATIYPFVRDFYSDKPLPSPASLFALQALLRGPLLVGIGAMVVTVIRSSRPGNAAAAAATLAGLGGLTALLAPNPLFPDDVRYVHLGEVGISNFVFGWIVGWMLTPATHGSTVHPTPAVPSPQ